MTNSKFTNDLANAHMTYGKAVLKGEKAATKFYDSIAHIPWTHWLSPKGRTADQSTSDQEWFEAMKLSLAKGRLSAADYKLYAADPRSLSKEKSAQRSEIVSVVGALVKDVKNAIKRRQEPKADATSNAKGKAQATKTGADKLTAQFDSIVKTIQGNDDWKFDAADMIAAIQKLAKQV